MAEYTVVGLVVLVGALAWAWLSGVARLRATWVGFAVFLVLTLVFDAILTGLPIVTYGAATLAGIRIGPIPVEDLLYGQALYLVAVAAWGPAASTTAGARA